MKSALTAGAASQAAEFGFPSLLSASSMDPVIQGRVVTAIAGVVVVLSLGACSSEGNSFDSAFCLEKRDAVALSMATVNDLLASLSSGTLTSDEVNRTIETGDGLMLSSSKTVMDWQVCFTDDDVAGAKKYLSKHS